MNMMIYKHLLGVQKQTMNIGVLLELGRVPLSLSAMKMSIKNWDRIRRGEANELLITSYREAVEKNLKWVFTIKETLEVNGMLNSFLGYDINGLFPVYRTLFQRLSDQFHQRAFENIRNEGCKLRTYSLFKTETGMEKYLVNINNIEKRSKVIKFRLSNHTLEIEKGRHKKIPKELRFCPFCLQCVESEIHFLFHCPEYVHLRERWFEATPEIVLQYNLEQKLYFFLSKMNQETVQFITSSLDLRQFLLAKHKTHV